MYILNPKFHQHQKIIRIEAPEPQQLNKCTFVEWLPVPKFKFKEEVGRLSKL